MECRVACQSIFLWPFAFCQLRIENFGLAMVLWQAAKPCAICRADISLHLPFPTFCGGRASLLLRVVDTCRVGRVLCVLSKLRSNCIEVQVRSSDPSTCQDRKDRKGAPPGDRIRAAGQPGAGSSVALAHPKRLCFSQDLLVRSLRDPAAWLQSPGHCGARVESHCLRPGWGRRTKRGWTP